MILVLINSNNKGKGKAEPASSSNDAKASSSTSTSTATASTSTSTSTSASTVRRAPVGKVIHYFADSPTQGYDGAKFTDTYQKHVLRLNEEQELSATKRAVEEQKREERLADLKEDDIALLVSYVTLCGVSRANARRIDSADRVEEGGCPGTVPHSGQQQTRGRVQGISAPRTVHERHQQW